MTKRFFLPRTPEAKNTDYSHHFRTADINISVIQSGASAPRKKIVVFFRLSLTSNSRTGTSGGQLGYGIWSHGPSWLIGSPSGSLGVMGFIIFGIR